MIDLSNVCGGNWLRQLVEEQAVAKADCGTGGESGGKRKACKNCSCGLREELESIDGAPVQSGAPKSACGNCGKGDAFRCATCPHRGTPAYEEGEVVRCVDEGNLPRQPAA